jgi:hypothetical protein
MAYYDHMISFVQVAVQINKKIVVDCTTNHVAYLEDDIKDNTSDHETYMNSKQYFLDLNSSDIKHVTLQQIKELYPKCHRMIIDDQMLDYLTKQVREEIKYEIYEVHFENYRQESRLPGVKQLTIKTRHTYFNPGTYENIISRYFPGVTKRNVTIQVV